MNLIEINSIIDKVILEFEESPVDFFNNGAKGELLYLNQMKSSYIRTIVDIVSSVPPNKNIKVLEIGSFLGIVSIVLSKIGYEVYSTELPEFISNKNLQRKLEENGVSYHQVNLKNYSLPFSPNTFDIVIMCEVLEHLNFNPIPIIKEINRIEKINGLFYLSLPNLASLGNRIKLLRGQSIHNRIEDYFLELNPDVKWVGAIHWREYTITEISEMLDKFDFYIDKQYYFDSSDLLKISWSLKALLKKAILSMFPSLKGNQTTIGRKTKNSVYKFFFSEATLPGNFSPKHDLDSSVIRSADRIMN
ncbi:MAG TPA: class I SAM-dependent methyltransferase [Candidatus Sericytochromatia bacterium]